MVMPAAWPKQQGEKEREVDERADDRSMLLMSERQGRNLAGDESIDDVTAIHPGTTQTGSHPISLIRIECSVRLSQQNRAAAARIGHEVRLGIVPIGAF
jgi:hypothetical protein